SNMPCSRIQRWRARATSARSCSAACRLFFESDVVMLEEAPHRAAAARNLVPVHRQNRLVQGQVWPSRNQTQQKICLLLHRRDAPAPRLSRTAARLPKALDPDNRRAGTDIKLLGRRAPRRPAFNFRNHSRPHVFRIGLRHRPASQNRINADRLSHPSPSENLLDSIGTEHALVAAPRYIVGQFNAHMASLLLLQADEAFWAGDKQAEGVLKDKVTGDHHRIEFKGIEPFRVRNFMRLLITSNADWVVPAAFGEKRFAIFDVGIEHKEDHPYFKAILHQMDNGGREALMHHLLNFDLSSVNLRSVPTTKALLDQQIASMRPEQSWWLDVLKGGQLPPVVEFGSGDSAVRVKNSCFTGDLYNSYVRHGRKQGVSRKAI